MVRLNMSFPVYVELRCYFVGFFVIFYLLICPKCQVLTATPKVLLPVSWCKFDIIVAFFDSMIPHADRALRGNSRLISRLIKAEMFQKFVLRGSVAQIRCFFAIFEVCSHGFELAAQKHLAELRLQKLRHS